MKTKEKKQLFEKTTAELRADLQKVKEAMHVLLLDKVQGKLKNTSSLTSKRKESALIQTVMRQKELAA